jgi:predicted dinucleotide-binding enzyme
VLLVVPYHRFFQPLPGSRAAVRYRECKQRLANLAASVPNSMVVDFMIPSEITSHDENYRHFMLFAISSSAIVGEPLRTPPDLRHPLS